MFTSLRARLAIAFIPRCDYCRTMLDRRLVWGRKVCSAPECIEQDAADLAYGL